MFNEYLYSCCVVQPQPTYNNVRTTQNYANAPVLKKKNRSCNHTHRNAECGCKEYSKLALHSIEEMV